MACCVCIMKPVTTDKKVTFNSIVKVAYFERTPIDSSVNWMQDARDRVRFNRRILDIERQIDWVFSPIHRDRIRMLCDKTL